MAPSEGQLDNCIFLGPHRIFFPWGRKSYTAISWLGAGGEQGVGGVGEDSVNVGEVMELFPSEVARVVASEL